MDLAKGREYYFDYYNKRSVYNSLLYTDSGDVEVSALRFRVSKHKDLMKAISKEENFQERFTLKKGAIPRKVKTEELRSLDEHIIVRLRPLNDTSIYFSVYDSARPISAPLERRFYFVQEPNEVDVFEFKLGSDYQEVLIDFKVDLGQVLIQVADNYEDFAKEYDTKIQEYIIKANNQEYIQYVVTPKEQSNDILIFRQIYVKVKAVVLSKYSAFVKPQNKFKELKALEPETVFTHPSDSIFLYYFLSKQRSASLQTLDIKIQAIKNFAERPEFLFIADEDVFIKSDSPFLPMQLRDLQTTEDEEFSTTSLQPEILPGYYVIKLKPHSPILPYKVSIVVDNQFSINPNSMQRDFISLKETSQHKYSVYVPQPGELRMLLESCSGVSIPSAEFYENNSAQLESRIQFDINLVQAFPYMFINNTLTPTFAARNTRELSELVFPVRRAILPKPGVVEFAVKADSAYNQLNRQQTKANYTLITEFRPSSKPLILKDYITVFEAEKDIEKYFYSYEYL